MAAPQNIIAVIFDFDDTLTDDSTTQLLEKHGINADDFWKREMSARVAAGWDPALAYLTHIADNSGNGKPFGKLSNAALREFGATLKFYPGLPRLFSDLRDITKEHPLSNPGIEFHVISGGLEDVIRGSKIASHLNGIRGCRFEEGPDGVIRAVKNVVSFTEKTRYIFEINKGLLGDSRDRPYDVNEQMHPENRRVPFQNMIYVGDGFTDVPCFSLVTHFGGKAFGVFDPKKIGSPKKAWEKLVTPQRVMSLNSPKYGPKDDLGTLLRVAVSSLCMNLDIRTRTALPR
jgi:phosphoserine phosphatase